MKIIQIGKGRRKDVKRGIEIEREEEGGEVEDM
jgi:hypothetical protein